MYTTPAFANLFPFLFGTSSRTLHHHLIPSPIITTTTATATTIASRLSPSPLRPRASFHPNLLQFQLHSTARNGQAPETKIGTGTANPDADADADADAARQVINDVQAIYKDLEDEGEGAKWCTYSTKGVYGPNVQFKYMSPPNNNKNINTGADDANNTSANAEHNGDGNNNHLETIFQNIESHQKSQQISKPIAIYLPGLDGVGISATTQFDDLTDQFEFWRMTIHKQDTTTSYTQLTNIVTRFINDVAISRNREFVLIGESFGGLLAPTVALRIQQQQKDELMKGLVLVNPATSFDQTQWSTVVPLLASLRHVELDQIQLQQSSSPSTTSKSTTSTLPTPYSIIGGIALALTVPDNTQFQTIFNIFSQTKVPQSTEEITNVLKTMRDGFGILADRLPAQVIEHRVNNWLNVGCMLLNEHNRLGDLNVQTLVVAGEDDNMLPTKKEADRLVQTLPNCTSIIVKGSGHFVLDNRFNLTKSILEAPFYNHINNDGNEGKKSYDPILDWKPPSPEIMKETIDGRVQPLRTLTSPVFFSTGSDGRRRKGLGFVPTHKYNYRSENEQHQQQHPTATSSTATTKPLLFVANHQLLGLDLGMIIAQLIEERSINARGLAHPIIFSGEGVGEGFGGEMGGGENNRNRNDGESLVEKRDRNGRIPDENPLSRGTFETFGAVMVTPRNYYRLMESSQAGLLFPGGVREVFHGKDEAYQLFWPEKVDFVRVAARFNATIVPISAVGAADSANVLIDAPDMLTLPFGLGERAANNTKNVISARYDMTDSEELFQPPLVVPKPLPSRHYFVFGQPFDTSDIGHKDKEACSKVYSDVKSELERGLADVLKAREKDPFKDTVSRLAYERFYGKQAPTFPLEELNCKN